jgi:AraC-like DNA-binding protein
LLERVFQSIEMRLSDPDLNIHQIASEHGISSRYLQKLFETHGESFSQYVKLRRLERCRLDLGSPLYAQRTISEILFQWGFNDSATFSRAFRDRYGVSPREYRKAPDREAPVELPRRGRPAHAREARSSEAENLTTPPGAEDLSPPPVEVRHHYLPARPDTIHWGFFSRNLRPALEVRSGDFVTIETLTHHANDDAERMIEGDAGAESVFRWTAEGKAVERRGAGPIDASALGRGPGEGFGVHICTGPIHIEDAQPGDVIEVRFLDIRPRPSANPRFVGRSFGSNAAAYWGFHYSEYLTEPRHREVVTIYEVETEPGRRTVAHAVYNYRWTPQTDPSGIVHERYDYPGVPVDPETIEKNFDVLRDVEIPVRPLSDWSRWRLRTANWSVGSARQFRRQYRHWRLGPGAKCSCRCRCGALRPSAIPMPRKGTANCAAPPSNVR